MGCGKAAVAQGHQQGDQRHGAHAAGDVLGGHDGEQQKVERSGLAQRDDDPVERRHGDAAPGAFAEHGDQIETEVRKQLQDAEQEQRTVEAQAQHERTADDGTENRQPDPDDLVGDADFGLGEGQSLDQEGGGETAGKGVAQFVENDQQQERCGARLCEVAGQRGIERLEACQAGKPPGQRQSDGNLGKDEEQLNPVVAAVRIESEQEQDATGKVITGEDTTEHRHESGDFPDGAGGQRL